MFQLYNVGGLTCRQLNEMIVDGLLRGHQLGQCLGVGNYV